MARTIQEIYDEIIAEKESLSNLGDLLPSGTSFSDLLSDITSGSKVAIWRLWAYVHAFATWVLENQQDTFKAEVELIKSKAIFGTATWWIEKMSEFQYGDPLIFIEIDGVLTLGYETIDESKQIIEASAITSTAGVSTIKVAKDNGSGELVALDTPEVTAVISYKDQLQPAGVSISIISLNADLLKIEADVYYNALLELSVVKANVETAINDYLKNIEFGGVMNRNKLIDAVQLVEGVNDIDINNLEGKPNAGTYVVIDREYETSAGYIKVDPAFTLEDNINYIPQ